MYVLSTSHHPDRRVGPVDCLVIGCVCLIVFFSFWTCKQAVVIPTAAAQERQALLPAFLDR